MSLFTSFLNPSKMRYSFLHSFNNFLTLICMLYFGCYFEIVFQLATADIKKNLLHLIIYFIIRPHPLPFICFTIFL